MLCSFSELFEYMVSTSSETSARHQSDVTLAVSRPTSAHYPRLIYRAQLQSPA